MNVLMIGGTGPTGTAIVQGLLAKSYVVTIYHTGAHEFQFSREVEHLHGDPGNPEDIVARLKGRRFDAVINTQGRIRFVADAFKTAAHTDKLVSISGHAVYASVWLPLPTIPSPAIPIPESDPLWQDPQTPYRQRTALGEQIVREAQQQGHFETVIVRYPRVYGPRAYGPSEWYFVKRIRDDRKHVILGGDGMTVIQRGYSENLAHAVILALESPKANGQIYNLGDERALTVRGIATLIAEALDHQWEMVPMPFAAAPLGDPFAAYGHTLLDLTKIKTELGYQDVVPVEEATRITARWLYEHPPENEEAIAGRFAAGPSHYEAENALIAGYQGYLASLPPRDLTWGSA